jgi:hypothetical protein
MKLVVDWVDNFDLFGMNSSAYSAKKVKRMTNFRLICAAAVSICAMTSSVMAGNMVSEPSNAGQSIYCATREGGNPHSKLCDYSAWSKWRERGSWDSSLDNACIRNPAFVPGECGLDPRSRS